MMPIKKMMMVLVIGLLTACGTGSNPNNNSNSGESENQIEYPKQNEIAANFFSSIETKEENNSIIVNYNVKNLSGRQVKLTFPSGLQADFIVYDEEGKKVKQYSEEVMSTQAIIEVTVENNQEIQNSFTISDLYNGHFKMEVFLTAKEEQAKIITDLIVERSLFTKISGIYVGQIDPHSIEVEIKGEKAAFQLKDEAINQLSTLKEGSEITFVYSEKDSQKTIEKFSIQ